MLIVYEDPGIGWSSITYMVQLCAEMFDAELRFLNTETNIGAMEKLLAFVPRRRGSETCLLVSAGPGRMLHLLSQVEGWKRRFGQVAAWVIEGYYPDHISRVVRHGGMFDRFFITTDEDVDAWQKLAGRPTISIPLGSDVLRLGTPSQGRPVDLLRVGRQPTEWEDDAMTETAARAKGLSFRGRPPMCADTIENHRMLMHTYGQSKFLLAFSNTVHRTSFTHPTRAYLTPRWPDGLAAGAIIAGIAPKSPTADRLLWPGATLDLGSTSRDEGLTILAAAVASWRPEQAVANYAMALERFDWRWRFADIAAALGESPARLTAELDHLKREIAKHR